MLLPTALFATPAHASGAGGADRLPIAGSEVYANGADLPWISYGNDIGGNAWGEYGFHADASKLESDFSAMHAQGVTTARVWFFADARAGIDFNSSGLPTGLDPEDVTDVDALTAAAASNGVYLNLVLFDSDFMENAVNLGSGVTGGGHGALINNGAGGQALERNVVLPILQHLAGNSAVFSIETMNEPESCIADDGDVNSSCGTPVSLANFNAWTSMVAADVHKTDPGMLVTVGSASSNWVKQYAGDGLDYYELHSYNDGYAPSVKSLPASSLGLDKPIVVGEYPAGSAATFKTSMDDYWDEGYAGAWAWSFGDVDSVGTYDVPTMTAWDQAHPDTQVGPTAPAALPEPVGQSDGVVDVFWRGPSGSMLHSWYVPGAGWNGPVDQGGSLQANPSPVAPGGGVLDVFSEGTDGSLWHDWYLPGAGVWYGPGDLGMGPLGGEPRGVSSQSGVIDVFWRGTDAGLWHAWYVGGWFGPQELAPGGSLTSNPVPVSSGGGNIAVFWKDRTGGLSDVTYRPASGWASPTGLAMGTVGAPSSAVAYGNGNQLVGWTGTDQNLWYATASTGPWSGPSSAGGGPLASSPQFASSQPGEVEAFWAGTSGSVWYEDGSPGGSWSGPSPLPSGLIGSQPMPVAPVAGLLDVFWRGADGGLWHGWGSSSGWAGPQHLAPAGSFGP